MFVFVSPYDSSEKAILDHLAKHGDGVKDVAFEVEDLDAIVKRLKERGGTVVRDIYSEQGMHIDSVDGRTTALKIERVVLYHYIYINFIR